MRPIEIIARKLSANCRESMRDSAIEWRKARARGDSKFTRLWLEHAIRFRDLAKGYLEAA